MFKISTACEPEYLADIFKNESRSGRIVIPNTKLSLAMNSFCFRGSNNWNLLPENLRKAIKIGEFKNGVKKWISLNVSRFLD